MKIAFLKIAPTPTPFEIEKDGVKFIGTLSRKNHSLIKCYGKIQGKIEHSCDRCGADIMLDLNEQISLLLSDGEYQDSEGELADVIEFFNGFIDLDEVLLSEIESYKSDYFYCDKCKSNLI
ncbi:DUF177 domain-containing protein [Campylobacter sp. 19-13652]|uniref:DUF177 domain-containing protein n=1 Tax=Campylobacter sp. 19-13652 TaxID=2840180 RepID=UPI001C78F4AD|nr:DUF177 domain-containing protein [Campylobacter sp. 19-13652]BCX78903.1 hypothetical protein LBC_03650 [Campylobacter sp. 19-13652]